MKKFLFIALILLSAQALYAQPGYVQKAQTSGTGVATGGESINLNASTTLLIVTIATSSSAATQQALTVKFNSVALTEFGQYNNTVGGMSVWYMQYPPTGSAYTLTWTMAGSYTWVEDATGWSAATQIGQCAYQYNATALTWANAITAQQASSMFYSVGMDTASTAYMPQTYTAGETQINGLTWPASSAVIGFSDGYETGPAAGTSESFSWIVGSTKISSVILMEVNAALTATPNQTATIGITAGRATQTFAATPLQNAFNTQTPIQGQYNSLATTATFIQTLTPTPNLTLTAITTPLAAGTTIVYITTLTMTPTPPLTATYTFTFTYTPTFTLTITPNATSTNIVNAFNTQIAFDTFTDTPTPALTATTVFTPQATWTYIINLISETQTPTASFTSTPTNTFTNTFTGTNTFTPSYTSTPNATWTYIIGMTSWTPTLTITLTATPIVSVTNTPTLTPTPLLDSQISGLVVAIATVINEPAAPSSPSSDTYTAAVLNAITQIEIQKLGH